ncbi:MAG TPA: FecR family protein, partial [Spirochaetota bacterium]|nr:FecR family protein [Spirochaetota bacterium]
MSRKHLNISDDEIDLFLNESGNSDGELPVVPSDVESRIIDSIRLKASEEKRKSAVRFRRILAVSSGLAAAVIFAVMTLFIVKPFDRNETGGIQSVRITGEAYLSKGGRRIVLSDRVILVKNDVIRTGPGSGLSISTGDDVAFTMSQKTELEVRSYDAHLKELVLDEGEVSISLARRAKGEKFVLMTDEAVVQVVGTSFTVVKEHDSTRISVSEGKVKITTRGATQVTQIISGGSSAVISGDQIDVKEATRPEENPSDDAADKPGARLSYNVGSADTPSSKETGKAESSVPVKKRDDLVIDPSTGHGYFVTGFRSWDAAEAEAIEAGGHLVKIDSASEEI